MSSELAVSAVRGGLGRMFPAGLVRSSGSGAGEIPAAPAVLLSCTGMVELRLSLDFQPDRGKVERGEERVPAPADATSKCIEWTWGVWERTYSGWRFPSDSGEWLYSGHRTWCWRVVSA